MKKLFTQKEKERISQAIELAEKKTSGEIRIHIEPDCKGEVLDRAAEVFAELSMHKTQLRNGVLIYIAVNSKKLAIIGDAGINAVVPSNFWDDEKEILVDSFRNKKYAEGLIRVIGQAGIELQMHFPFIEGTDQNEITNEISFGS